MRKIIYSIILATAWLIMTVPSQICAQKANIQETVQEVLAKMPCDNKDEFNRQMSILMNNPQGSMQELARLLQPFEKHANEKVEFAINGAVNFCCAKQEWKDGVKKALNQAIPVAADKYAKLFLEKQLRLLSPETDVVYEEQTGVANYVSAYRKLESMGDKAGNGIVKALGSKDRAYRMQALKYAAYKGLITDKLAADITKKYASYPTETKVDILNWLGDNKVQSQKEFIKQAIKDGGEPSKAAVEALGRLGGNDALDILLGQLGTDNDNEAFTALSSYKEEITPSVISSVASKFGSAPEKQQLSLIRLAGKRHVKSVAPQILELAEGSNKTLSDAAIDILPNVVTASNLNDVASLLQKVDESKVPTVQKAFSACQNGQEAKAKYEAIHSIIEKADKKERFFPMLAATNTDASVSDLQKFGTPEAIKALKQSNNYKATAPLLQAAKSGDEEALNRFVALNEQYEKNIDNRYYQLEYAMEAAKSKTAKETVLKSLSNIPCRFSCLLAGRYLDDNEVGYAAAVAEKKIMAENKEDVEYDKAKSFIEKSISLYQQHGTANDLKAVDELKAQLNKLQPFTAFQLPEDEKAEGFEMLFDGTNLDNWTGNTVNYIPINGAICVVPDKTGSGNLYSKKQYSNFVLRFEFAFTRGGANNGIGLRTEMGGHGISNGLCECQILDHDDPMYDTWLKPWQVHGSVYGLIPAKRVKHKPMGEWGVEEIRVEGNRIKVTVNGEVIIDGDVKEACMGHNTSDDGKSPNPYTPAHYNHPKLFIKSGHIAFLGHGPGVKFRNVRVLDISKKKK